MSAQAMNGPRPPSPLSSDLMGAISELEREYRVQEWQVAGVPVWPLLRVRWMFAEWARHYGDASPGPAPSRVAGIARRVAPLIHGPLAARRAQAADSNGSGSHGHSDVVFLSDGVSFARLGDRWVERFCDPLIRHAGERGLQCALWTPTHHYLTPRLTPSRFIQPVIDRANIVGALRATVLPGPFNLPDLEAVRTKLAALGLGASSFDTRKIVSDAWRLESIARMHEVMLKRAQPRLAFVVSFYGIEGMAFVLACRRAGVRVVDIQHGVQGDLHPAYARWPRPARSDHHPLLPDHFWVWSDWERRIIDEWAAGTAHTAIAAGNPWLDVWCAESGWPGASEALEASRRLRAAAGDKPVVLVTLQPGLAADEQMGPLAAFMARSADRFVFWVRLHPAMLHEREGVKGALPATTTFEVDSASDLPLPALLRRASVHVTHSSSTCIEAAQFGLRSIITSAYGAELFAPLVASGMARHMCWSTAGLSDALADSARHAESAVPDGRRLPSSFDALLQGTAPSTNRHRA